MKLDTIENYFNVFTRQPRSSHTGWFSFTPKAEQMPEAVEFGQLGSTSLPVLCHAFDSASLLSFQGEVPASLPHGDIPTISPLLVCSALWELFTLEDATWGPRTLDSTQSSHAEIQVPLSMKRDRTWVAFLLFPSCPVLWGPAPIGVQMGDTAHQALIPKASPGPE